MHPAYHRLARTERYRWWKPLVELLLVVVLVFLLAIAVVAPALFLTRFANDGAAGLITLGLSIAVAIPAALLAARMTGRPWRALFSVDGRLRGRWFAVCLLVAVGETLVGLIAVNTFCALGYGPDPGAWVGWSEFAPLAISVMAVIPLQAAAEEVFFRGTLMQALGAWVRPAWFAILISSLAFGLLHMLPLAGLAWVTALGLVAGWLTVRTGGLEAAIALHAVNNVSNFLLEAASGRGDRWVTEMNADVRWSSTLFGVMFFVLYGFVIARLHAEQFPPAGERAVEPLAPAAETPAVIDDLPA